jgi:hypothetical protein
MALGSPLAILLELQQVRGMELAMEFLLGLVLRMMVAEVVEVSLSP